jgi:hypothetical protein
MSYALAAAAAIVATVFLFAIVRVARFSSHDFLDFASGRY